MTLLAVIAVRQLRLHLTIFAAAVTLQCKEQLSGENRF